MQVQESVQDAGEENFGLYVKGGEGQRQTGMYVCMHASVYVLPMNDAQVRTRGGL